MPPTKKTTKTAPKKAATPPVKLVAPPVKPAEPPVAPVDVSPRAIRSRRTNEAASAPLDPVAVSSLSTNSEPDLMSDLIQHNEQLTNEVSQLRQQLSRVHPSDQPLSIPVSSQQRNCTQRASNKFHISKRTF